MEVESYNWSHLFVNIYVDYFSFLVVNRTGTVGWTQCWISAKVCAHLMFLVSNSLQNHGGQKKIMPMSQHKEFWTDKLNWTFLWNVWFSRDAVYFKILLKFIYFEKATKFWEIFPLVLTTVHTVKVKGRFRKILWPSQNLWTLII